MSSVSVFQLQNIYARQCVDASDGLCTRHNLCRTDHIEIYIVYNGGLLLFRGENLADLLRLKDRLDLHSNFRAQILHWIRTSL